MECKHGMVADWCSSCHRLVDQDAIHRKRYRAQGFTASYEGVCAAEGDLIAVGDLIVARPEGYCHSECLRGFEL